MRYTPNPHESEPLYLENNEYVTVRYGYPAAIPQDGFSEVMIYPTMDGRAILEVQDKPEYPQSLKVCKTLVEVGKAMQGIVADFNECKNSEKTEAEKCKHSEKFVVIITKDKRYTVNGNAAEADLYAGRIVEQLTGEAHCFKGIKALKRSYKGFQKDFLFNVKEGKSVFCTITSDRKPDLETAQRMRAALEAWLKDHYRFSYAIIVLEPLDDGSWHIHLVVCFEDEIPATFEEEIKKWASSYNDKPSDEQVDVQPLLTKKDVMRVWAYLDPTSPKKRHRAVFYEKGMKNFSVFRSSGAPKSLEVPNDVVEELIEKVEARPLDEFNVSYVFSDPEGNVIRTSGSAYYIFDIAKLKALITALNPREAPDFVNRWNDYVYDNYTMRC